MRPTQLAFWSLLPVVALAQSCRDPKPEPYVPFSVNYDVTSLVPQPGYDTVPRWSTGYVALDEASGAVMRRIVEWTLRAPGTSARPER